MNILVLSELIFPQGSGAELATSLWCDLLSKAGANIRIITSGSGGEHQKTKTSRIETLRLPLFAGRGKYSTLLRSDVFTSSVMRSSIDWSDVVYIPRFWYSAIPIVRRRKKPVITHMHDYYAVCPLSTIFDTLAFKRCVHECKRCTPRNIYNFERIYGRSFRRQVSSVLLNSTVGRFHSDLVRYSNAIICVSKAQQQLIIQRDPDLGPLTSVVYNPPPPVRERPVLGNDFGYFGGSDPIRGFGVLEEAMRRASLRRRVTLHATKVSRSKAEKKESGIIAYPKVPPNEFDRIYEKIATVVIPSLWDEPAPYTLVEAMMSGRIVIGSKVGGMAEISGGSKGVLLVEPGNVRELAGTIDYVGGMDREKISDLATQNVDSINRLLSEEESVKRFFRVCEKTLVA